MVLNKVRSKITKKLLDAYCYYLSKVVNYANPPVSFSVLCDNLQCVSKISPYTKIWLSKKSYKKFGFYLSVDPKDIIYQTKHGEVPFLDNSDWHTNSRHFKEHDSIKQIFIDRLEWHQTSQYKLMMDRVDKGLPTYGCKSRNDVEDHIHSLRNAWQNLKEYGYVQQGFTNQHSLYPDDILVSIDSSGVMYLERNGTHRLTMAKYLNLDSVDVYVIRTTSTMYEKLYEFSVCNQK